MHFHSQPNSFLHTVGPESKDKVYYYVGGNNGLLYSLDEMSFVALIAIYSLKFILSLILNQFSYINS